LNFATAEKIFYNSLARNPRHFPTFLSDFWLEFFKCKIPCYVPHMALSSGRLQSYRIYCIVNIFIIFFEWLHIGHNSGKQLTLPSAAVVAHSPPTITGRESSCLHR